ncbi:MAG: polysaccharide deacetylase family protein [Chlorobi bacterium]|nr:polysaccharide deacetylase family protein [Chlorobiota bacterium]
MKNIILTVSLFMLAGPGFMASAQKKIWNGKECAVVLTYDDALDVQLDNVIPALDKRGLKGTFYLPGEAKTLYTRLSDWRKAAAEGHELGNHTMFHPCHGKSKKRKWVKPDYDLDNYSVKRITDELIAGNTLLKAIDGKTERTFAYTCGDTTAGNESFVNEVKKLFSGARGTQYGLNYFKTFDLYNIKIFGAKGKTGEEMTELVKKAQKENALVVFLFHGVGGAYLVTDTEEHNKLLDYLNDNKDKIWTAPMVEVTEYVKKHRK